VDTLELMDKMRTLLAAGQKIDAAILLPHLIAAVTGEAREAFATWPVCAACHGIGELLVPDLGKNVSCQVEPSICPGNNYGRMSPEQFALYMEAKLRGHPLPDGVEEVKAEAVPQRAEAGPGLVEYLKRRAERFKS
jgi:hypothetical protein